MSENGRVLVTGADGMLGASVCRELIKQQYQVRAFILPNRKTNVIENIDIEIVTGDILDSSKLKEVMSGCDFVVNIAALTSVWPRASEKVMQVNFQGAINVMESAEKVGVKKLIHIGSANSFNHGTAKNPGNEKSNFDGWKYQMDYINSKYLAQQKLLQFHQSTNFPIVIINPTFMIGPFDSGPSSGKMILEVAQGKIPFYSAGGKNFVYSRDVAVAIVNAIKLGKAGECYIAGNENLSFKDFFRKIYTIKNKKFDVFNNEFFAGSRTRSKIDMLV